MPGSDTNDDDHDDDDQGLFERDTGKSPDIGAPDEEDVDRDSSTDRDKTPAEEFEEDRELFERIDNEDDDDEQ